MPIIKSTIMNHIEQYQCASCGGIFEKGRTDDEANEEANDIWGVENASENSDMVVICDDCFNRNTKEEVREMGCKFKSNSNN
jgi:5-methylcytosine-specific restriction endonuclease McrA